MDYFIPANEKGYGLAQTFIIDGVGHDLYPRSWERMERMANLDDYNPTCLGYAEILYARSEEDKNRFLGLQEKLRRNLDDYGFMYQKALEKLNVAMELYQTMMFEEAVGRVRMAAGFIADYLSCAVAFVNHTYFKYSQIEQIVELSAMKEIPGGFIKDYKAIILAKSAEELKALAHSMISSARCFLGERKPQKKESALSVNFKGLAGWYQELCYTWSRIYFWAGKNDMQKVFVWGCMQQQELNTVKEEFGLNDMDLMGYYSAAEVGPFVKRAKELEAYVTAQVKSHGVSLNAYASVDEFILKNSWRVRAFG